MSQGIWSQRECVSPLETAGKQLPADRQSLRYFFYFQFWFSPPLKPTQESCTFWEQQTWKRRFWYYRARSGYNTLQQHSPRQLHLTKFTSCFGDLAHRQGISYPSLIWLGAAAAMAFWTVSTYLKFHFLFLPASATLSRLPVIKCKKQNTCPIIQLLWWWHTNLH